MYLHEKKVEQIKEEGLSPVGRHVTKKRRKTGYFPDHTAFSN